MKLFISCLLSLSVLLTVISGCASGGPLSRLSRNSCKEIKAIGTIMSTGEDLRIKAALRQGLTFSGDSAYTSIQTLRGFREAVIFKGSKAPVYAGITEMQMDHTQTEKDYNTLMQGLQKCFGVPARTVNGDIKNADFTANDFFIRWQSVQPEGKEGYNVIYISGAQELNYVAEFR